MYKFITNISCLVEGGDQLKVKVVIKPNVVIKLVKVVINVVISLSKKRGSKVQRGDQRGDQVLTW